MKGLAMGEGGRDQAGLFFFFGGATLWRGPSLHPADAPLLHVPADPWARVVSTCHFPRVTQTLTN